MPEETYRIIVVAEGVEGVQKQFRNLGAEAEKVRKKVKGAGSGGGKGGGKGGGGDKPPKPPKAPKPGPDPDDEKMDKAAKRAAYLQRLEGAWRFKEVRDEISAQAQRLQTIKKGTRAREMAEGALVDKLNKLHKDAIIMDKKFESDKIKFGEAAALRRQKAEGSVYNNLNKDHGKALIANKEFDAAVAANQKAQYLQRMKAESGYWNWLGEQHRQAIVEDKNLDARKLKNQQQNRNASQVAEARYNQQRFNQSAQAQNKEWNFIAQQRRKQVAEEAKQAKQLARQKLLGQGGGVGQELTALGTGVYFLKRALATIGVFQAVSSLVEFADAAKSAENRLRNLTSSENELRTVMLKLRGVADETRASFSNTSEIFSRMSFATQGMGYSQQQLLGVTRSLNQSILISGARSQEASNALIQFSQALGSNRLGGDEFRAVAEQLPFVMRVIADSLGVPIGKLKVMAQQGKLTTKVLVDAFVNAADSIDEKAKNVSMTIEQSVLFFKNQMLYFVADMDKATGASTDLANSIAFLGKNMDFLARALAVVVSTVTLNLAIHGIRSLVLNFAKIGPALASLAEARAAFAAGAGTFEAVMVAAGGPIGFLIGLVLTLISVLLIFSDKIIINERLQTSWRDTIISSFKVIGSRLNDLRSAISDFFKDYTNQWKIAHEMEAYYRAKINEMVDTPEIGPPQIQPLSGFQEFALKGLHVLDILLTGPARLEEAFSLSIESIGESFSNMFGDVLFRFYGFLGDMVKKLREFIELVGTFDEFKLLGTSKKGLAKDVTQPFLTSLGDAQRELEAKNPHTNKAKIAFEEYKKNMLSEKGPLEKAGREVFDDANMTAFYRKRAAAAKLADLTNKPPEKIDTSGQNEALSKWAVYVQKLEEELSLLKLIGTEEEKSIARKIIEGNAAVRDKKNGIKGLNLIQAMYVAEQAKQQFMYASAEKAGKKIAEIAYEGYELQILKTEELQRYLALQGVEEAAGRKLGIIDQDAINRMTTSNELAKTRQSLYHEIVDPVEDLMRKETALNQLYEDRVITFEEYKRVLLGLHKDLSEMDNSVRGGILNAVETLRSRSLDLGKDVSSFLVGAFDKVTDALIEFTDSGKIGLRTLIDLVHDLAGELIKMAANQLIASLLSNVGNPSYGGPGSLSLPAFNPRDYATSPLSSGDRQGSGYGTQPSSAAPVVNVYNVLDPRDIPAALATPAGKQAVLNVISRHPESVKRILGAG